jgi:hypothetical protein
MTMRRICLIAFCLSFCQAAFGQSALLHHTTSAGTGVANAGTLAITATTSTDTLIVAISCDSTPNTTATVTDTQSNTFTQRTAITWSGKRLYLLEAHNIGSGADTLTITTGCGGVQDVLVDEFTGLSTTTPFDQSGTNTATNTALTVSTSGATTTANETVYAAFVATSGTITAGSGYTSTGTGASANRVLNAESQRITSTGTQTATATESASQAYAAAVITMAEPGGGGGATCNGGLLMLKVGGC